MTQTAARGQTPPIRAIGGNAEDMVNKAIIIGNLGKDPAVEFLGSGKAVCKFPVATSEKWTDDKGDKQEKTTWHNVVVWGKQAESCGQYLQKGSRVFVEGKIDNRTYDKADGTKGYASEIIARDVRFLSAKPQGGQRSTDPGAPTDDGDEVPF